MTTPREGQSATLLDNGQVPMADGTGATAATELYAPASENSTATGSMPAVRNVDSKERPHDPSASPQ